MKRLLSVVFVFVTLLAGCGTVTDQGVLFKTADPALAILVPFSSVDAPLLPTVTPTAAPEVVPAEEVGETVPDPIPAPPAIVVKGNISSSGEKIYHVPGGAYYDAVKIDEAAGEKFFDSEEEAVAAGWRKSSR